MEAFVELLQSSAIVQGILAIMLVGAIIYQVVAGQNPSDLLVGLASVIFGYYFGTKTQQALVKSHVAAAQALADAQKLKEGE